MKHFTKEQIEEIRIQLATKAVRDSDFDVADSLADEDLIPILQDGINKTAPAQLVKDNVINEIKQGVDGKVLSSNDYTDEDKEKLGGVATGAQVNVIEGVKVNGSDLPLDSSKKVNVIVPDVSQFITKSVNDLINYYRKSEVYTKEEVDYKIIASGNFHYEVYASIQEVTQPAPNILYLIGPFEDETEGENKTDRYQEWVYSHNEWVQIGDTSIDLSDYITTAKLNTALASYQETLVSGTNIKTVNGQSIVGSGNLEVGDLNAIKFIAQTLTDGQKTQARTNIEAGTYSKPSGGIPKADLASGVQASLELADSAIQAEPVGSVTPAIDPYTYATKSEVSQLGQEVTDLNTQINAVAGPNYEPDKVVKANGQMESVTGWGVTDFVPYESGNQIVWNFGGENYGSYALQAYDSNKQPINNGYWGASGTDGVRTIPANYMSQYAANAAYIRASFRLTNTDASVTIGNTIAWTPQILQPGISVRLSTLESTLQTETERIDGEISQVDSEIDAINLEIDGNTANYVPGFYLDSNGNPVEDAEWGYSDYIPCIKDDVIVWTFGESNTNYPCLNILKSDKTFITYYGALSNGEVSKTITNNYSASAYIRVSFKLSAIETAGVTINGEQVWSPRVAVNGIKPRLSSLEFRVDETEEEIAQLQAEISTMGGGVSQGVLAIRRAIQEDAPYFLAQETGNYNGSHLDNVVRSIPNGKSFAFVTDTHWENANAKKSNHLLDYIRKRKGIRTIVFGGDAIGNVQNTAYIGANVLAQYSEELFSAFGDKVLWVQGNHDTNVPGIPTWVPGTYAVGNRVVNIEQRGCFRCIEANSDATFDATKWEAENLFIDDVEINKRTISHLANVAYDEAGIERIDGIISNQEDKTAALAWMRRHYHYDDAVNKLRFIVLETYDYGFAAHIVFGGYGIYYLQFDWLAEVLKSTPPDYTIVLCGHQINSGSEVSFYTRRLYQLLAAYLNSGSISITLRRSNTSLSDTAEQDNYGYIHEFWGSSSPSVGKAKTFDFSGVTPCKLFCIGGHYHMDDAFITRANVASATDVQSLEYVTTTPVAGDILTIVTNRDCYNRRYDGDRLTKYPNSESPTLTPGTITEQSFDIVTITEDGRIVCTRVGAGSSRSFIFPNLP